MAPWLILLVGSIYLFCSVEYFIGGNIGMAIVFFAYALSNVGFWIAG